MALNKADLVDSETVESISRQLAQGGAKVAVAISATNKKTLAPLLEQIGQMLSQDLNLPNGEKRLAANHYSRIA